MTGSTQTQEIRALNFSLALTVLFAGGAVVIALFSDSGTMTLEAITSGIDIVLDHGVLLAGECVGAIVDAVRDLLHPDPVEDAHLVVIHSGISFVLSVVFGQWMRRTGVRIASPLVQAEAQLWIIDGWMALGACAAFVVSMLLGRLGTIPASARTGENIA